VDEEGKELCDTYKEEVYYNGTYSVESPAIPTYQLKDDSQAIIAGTMPAENVTVKVVYEKIKYPYDFYFVLHFDMASGDTGTVGNDGFWKGHFTYSKVSGFTVEGETKTVTYDILVGAKQKKVGEVTLVIDGAAGTAEVTMEFNDKQGIKNGKESVKYGVYGSAGDIPQQPGKLPYKGSNTLTETGFTIYF
jgi:hypothetical protein